MRKTTALIGIIVAMSVVIVVLLVLILLRTKGRCFEGTLDERLPDLHHVVFGGGAKLFAAAAASASKTALISGAATSESYSEGTMLRLYREAYPDTPEHPCTQRGYGYWRWKPTLILDKMDDPRVQEGDLLLYTDSAVDTHHLEVFAKSMLDETLDLLCFRRDEKLRPFSTRESQIRLELSDSVLDGYFAVEAAVFLMRNNVRTKMMLERWRDAMKDPLVVEDSTEPEPEGFKDHRHDQVVLSAVVNHMVDAGELNVRFLPIIRKNCHFLHHRSRSLNALIWRT